MGKFYELYHMDAETAVKELGLVFMKVRYYFYPYVIQISTSKLYSLKKKNFAERYLKSHLLGFKMEVIT